MKRRAFEGMPYAQLSILIPEMTSGPGFETLKVCAGEFTTSTLENVPEILILGGGSETRA